MQQLQWHTEKRVVDTLVPHTHSPRIMTKKQTVDLKKSLTIFGLVEIPALDTDNTILAGHQRVRILQLLGKGSEEIDVRVPNRKLTEEERNRYMISSNAITGDWDYAKLKDFDLDLLLDIGFDKAELNKIWSKDLETENDDFDVQGELAAIKTPSTRLGDIILLGESKLICGDATDPKVLEKLFGDERVDVICSDPIYNLKIDYNSGLGGKQHYGGTVNDDRTTEEYIAFIERTLDNALAVSRPDVHVFYWCDQSKIWIIQTTYNKLGITNRRVCVWIKNGHNATPLVAFNKCYEPCVYGTKGKPDIAEDIQNLTEVLNKEIGNGNNLMHTLDVWPVKRLAGKDYEHATSKPPTVYEKAFKRCSKPGDIILDSFCGSGSSLIAAHQLNRRLYGVELEPQFCDVIIRRFEKLTGIKARVIRDEETS